MSRVGRFFIRKKIVIVQSCHQIKRKENGTFKSPSVFWHTLMSPKKNQTPKNKTSGTLGQHTGRV